MPKVSVVIPVYNAERHLRQCIDSVTAQSFKDIEVICVDDGSTDGSPEILKEVAERDGRVSVLTRANGGVSMARNTGLDAASGEYVLFLDADDFSDPTMIDEILTRCEADDAEIGIFKVRYVYEDDDLTVEADWSLRMDVVPSRTPFNRCDMSGSILFAITPAVWNKLFRREFLVREGLRFSPALRRAEDVPFTYLALMKAGRITVVDRPLLNYRKGLGGSLRATIHEDPTEICRALEITRDGAVEAGLFAEVERDFVNAALYQCLFTLEALGTAEAFHELYDALKTVYFDTLGISGHRRDFFFKPHHYDRYCTIMESSWDDYLFGETKTLRSLLGTKRDRASRAPAMVEAPEVRTEDFSEQAAWLIDESRSLRNQLEEAKVELGATKLALAESKLDLEAVSDSWLYQLARYLKSAVRQNDQPGQREGG